MKFCEYITKMYSRSRNRRRHLWILLTVTVYSLKIIGLAPFSVGSENKLVKTFVDDRLTLHNHRSFYFLLTKTGLAYNITLIVLIPVMVVRHIPQLLAMKNVFESPVTKVINIEQGILCVFTAWVIIVSWTLRRGRAISVLNELFDVQGSLNSLAKKRSYEVNFNKTTFIFSIGHVIFVLFLWITTAANEGMQSVISDAIINWCFFTVPSFIIFRFITQYSFVVRLVARNLHSVNQNLSNFLTEFRHREVWTFPAILDGTPPHAIDFRNSADIRSNKSLLNAVHSIQKIRTTISELCHDIDSFFSFPMLLCATHSFFSLIYNVYYLNIIAFLENRDSLIAGALTTVTWICISVYPLILLFVNVSKTVAEAKLTGRIVHKLLAAEMKDEIKTELERFSLQLLHEKIKFTACGFFILDFTFLYSMLGATATNLVILIQFQYPK